MLPQHSALLSMVGTDRDSCDQ